MERGDLGEPANEEASSAICEESTCNLTSARTKLRGGNLGGEERTWGEPLAATGARLWPAQGNGIDVPCRTGDRKQELGN